MAFSQPSKRPKGLTTVVGVCLVLGIIGFLLLTEHRAHVFGILPYLLLAACPIIHLFMHRGHGHHADGPPTGNPHDGHARHRGVS